MPNLKDIKRRIGSVQNTQQITSAMRMVSAAKLRRAQDAILAARPYAKKMYATLGEIGKRQKDAQHVLLQPHSAQKVLEVVVVTSDRGLCGGYNSNAIKAAERVIKERGAGLDQIVVSAVGRKAAEYFGKRREVVKRWTGLGNVEYGHAVEIAEHLAGRYEAGQIDASVLVYNEFVSAMTQTPNTDAQAANNRSRPSKILQSNKKGSENANRAGHPIVVTRCNLPAAPRARSRWRYTPAALIATTPARSMFRATARRSAARAGLAATSCSASAKNES